MKSTKPSLFSSIFITLFLSLSIDVGRSDAKPAAKSTNCMAIRSVVKNYKMSNLDRNIILITESRNGNVSKEKAFLSLSDDDSIYIRWNSSQDKFRIDISENSFSFKRGENGQSYAGNCIEERVPFPPAAYMYVDSVVGSVFSAPGNVSGKFKFIYK
jgi:hypothetical protein